MQLFLPSCELHSYGLGFAGCELTYVPAPRSINQWTEGIERFDGMRDSNPIYIAQFIVLQLVIDTLECGRLPHEQSAPFGPGHFVKTGTGIVLPAIHGCPAMLNCGINILIRFRHLLKAGVVDHQIWTQHVEQGI